MPQSLPVLTESFSSLSDRYEALICDVWGVLHNGVVVTRAANIALAAARKRGLAVVMLTNAPRMPEEIARFIAHLGGTDDAWDAIVSSGGTTRRLMEGKGARPFHHIGPKRDVSIFAGLAAVATELASAEYVLCSGLFDDETETAEDYRPQLEAMLARGMEMICANPDIVVERGHRLIPCGGAVADLYERMGGPVTWVGKPHPLVYTYAQQAIEARLGRPVAKERILAIGDALRTDIAGAAAYGVDSLLVLDGIHSNELGPAGKDFSPAAVEAFLRTTERRPTHVTVALKD